jgi:myo-inositol-1(or 4)-monophosphatase
MDEMIQEFTEFSKKTAIEAGKILKEGFETDFKIDEKTGRNNIVTEYDHKSEDYIISRIKENYPDHKVLAEESGYSNKDENEALWIIDPLDGTVNYAHGIPIYSVSIALQYKGEIVSGAVYQPELDEIFYAGKGLGAFQNDKKINVSKQSDFYRSLLVTGFPYNINENPGKTLETFVDIISKGIPIRRLGSAALDLVYVAKGRFEGFWEVALNAWDVAAGILIVKEAGGKVTNYNNEDHNIFEKTIVATNGIIHDELVKLIKENYED